ncbi:MAG: dicarboxylate/amino acid:cation symporter [Bacteroidales bacterium]
MSRKNNKIQIPFHWQIIVGMLLGIIWSIASVIFGWSEFTANWISPFGTIFINLLKLVAVPLVLFCIISGIASMGDPKMLGKLGIQTLTMYFFTTLLAVTLGLALVNIISPGEKVSKDTRIDNRIRYELWAESENVEILGKHHYSSDSTYVTNLERVSQDTPKDDQFVDEKIQIARTTGSEGPLQALVDVVSDNIFLSLSDNNSMLKIIFFAILFGISMVFLPKGKAKPIIKISESLMEIFLKMMEIIMRGAPFFVFALMASMITSMANESLANIGSIFEVLSWYALTVIIGLVLMGFVVYPILFKIFVKDVSFLSFLKAINPAQTLAFTTSSSAATLPVTLECVEENLGVDNKISAFVLPIGATVNMDGTCLYQAVAVMFLAQLHMIDLSFGQQITIVITATLASIGSAAVPSAGIVMLILVLQSVGLNPAWIGIILPFDRILDMMRTCVNVTGDATVCSIISRSKIDN